MNEVRARFRPYYIVNLVWLPIVLVVLGAWILTSQPSPDWAVAAVVMLGFAAGILYMLRRAIARFGSDAMIVDDKGIDHWTWGMISWEDVERIEFLKTMPAFSFVYALKIDVRNPESYLGNISAVERLLRNKSFTKTSGSLELLLNGLSIRPERIGETATAFFDARQR
ncbi:MAG: hypothetical protein KJP17_09640 [Gammaproteobacteria bacterium]|nr:hypothetical protein [Gammaproteobacteria bacterium]